MHRSLTVCGLAAIALLLFGSEQVHAHGVAIGSRAYNPSTNILSINGHAYGDGRPVLVNLRVYIWVSGTWVEYTRPPGWIGWESNLFSVGLYNVGPNASVKLVLTLQPEDDWLDGTGLNIVEQPPVYSHPS